MLKFWRSFPGGAPPVFESYADWERFAERLLDLELADTYRRIWWDARPHPGFGTLEVRMPDQPSSVEATAAFAALAQALVATARPGSPADRGVYAENRWAAFRFGRGARLIHPDGRRLVPVPEPSTSSRARRSRDRLGSAELLAPLRALDQADEQLEVGRRDGLDALCRRLVDLT